MTIDLARFPSLEQLVSSSPDGWSESDVPLARRGVRVSWLVGMVRDLLIDINRPRAEASAEAQRAIDHNRAGMWGRHDQPDVEVPRVPKFALLNVRSLVDHFVLPLTAALRSPLWACVPEEHRGVPDCFVSHTWNSLLLGPPQQALGTLDAIEHLDQFAWIDFVAYNQHAILSIPEPECPRPVSPRADHGVSGPPLNPTACGMNPSRACVWPIPNAVCRT